MLVEIESELEQDIVDPLWIAKATETLDDFQGMLNI
jgi:hypothetical protein